MASKHSRFHEGFGIQEPDDILSPSHYDAILGQEKADHSLPLWCYTSDRFWEAEKHKIFLKSWNMLDREEIVENPGDFHCLSLLGVKLIMVRGTDGKVRVFANTCRHRGATVAEGAGNCKAFRCPYHFWTYKLDGQFIGAPAYTDSDGAKLITDESKDEYDLIEIESGTWGGFVFVRFESGPETLEEHLGLLPEILKSHRLEDMRRAKKVVHEMDANWKCFVENYIDGYHIAYVHKDSLALWDDSSKGYVRWAPKGQEYVTFSQHDGGSKLLLPLPGYEGFPAMDHLDADKKNGTFFITLRPGVLMSVGNDGALVFQSEPISAHKSRLTVSSLFPKSVFGREDFDRVSRNYYRRNDIVITEDKDIALRQFAGLLSPYARIPRLSGAEVLINGFGKWVLGRVLDFDTSEQPTSVAAE